MMAFVHIIMSSISLFALMLLAIVQAGEQQRQITEVDFGSRNVVLPAEVTTTSRGVFLVDVEECTLASVDWTIEIKSTMPALAVHSTNLSFVALDGILKFHADTVTSVVKLTARYYPQRVTGEQDPDFAKLIAEVGPYRFVFPFSGQSIKGRFGLHPLTPKSGAQPHVLAPYEVWKHNILIENPTSDVLKIVAIEPGNVNIRLLAIDPQSPNNPWHVQPGTRSALLGTLHYSSDMETAAAGVFTIQTGNGITFAQAYNLAVRLPPPQVLSFGIITDPESVVTQPLFVSNPSSIGPIVVRDAHVVASAHHDPFSAHVGVPTAEDSHHESSSSMSNGGGTTARRRKCIEILPVFGAAIPPFAESIAAYVTVHSNVCLSVARGKKQEFFKVNERAVVRTDNRSVIPSRSIDYEIKVTFIPGEIRNPRLVPLQALKTATISDALVDNNPSAVAYMEPIFAGLKPSNNVQLDLFAETTFSMPVALRYAESSAKWITPVADAKPPSKDKANKDSLWLGRWALSGNDVPVIAEPIFPGYQPVRPTLLHSTINVQLLCNGTSPEKVRVPVTTVVHPFFMTFAPPELDMDSTEQRDPDEAVGQEQVDESSLFDGESPFLNPQQRRAYFNDRPHAHMLHFGVIKLPPKAATMSDDWFLKNETWELKRACTRWHNPLNTSVVIRNIKIPTNVTSTPKKKRRVNVRISNETIARFRATVKGKGSTYFGMISPGESLLFCFVLDSYSHPSEVREGTTMSEFDANVEIQLPGGSFYPMQYRIPVLYSLQRKEITFAESSLKFEWDSRGHFSRGAEGDLSIRRNVSIASNLTMKVLFTSAYISGQQTMKPNSQSYGAFSIVGFQKEVPELYSGVIATIDFRPLYNEIEQRRDILQMSANNVILKNRGLKIGSDILSQFEPPGNLAAPMEISSAVLPSDKTFDLTIPLSARQTFDRVMAMMTMDEIHAYHSRTLNAFRTEEAMFNMCMGHDSCWSLPLFGESGLPTFFNNSFVDVGVVPVTRELPPPREHFVSVVNREGYPVRVQLLLLSQIVDEKLKPLSGEAKNVLMSAVRGTRGIAGARNHVKIPKEVWEKPSPLFVIPPSGIRPVVVPPMSSVKLGPVVFHPTPGSKQVLRNVLILRNNDTGLEAALLQAELGILRFHLEGDESQVILPSVSLNVTMSMVEKWFPRPVGYPSLIDIAQHLLARHKVTTSKSSSQAIRDLQQSIVVKQQYNWWDGKLNEHVAKNPLRSRQNVHFFKLLKIVNRGTFPINISSILIDAVPCRNRDMQLSVVPCVSEYPIYDFAYSSSVVGIESSLFLPYIVLQPSESYSIRLLLEPTFTSVRLLGTLTFLLTGNEGIDAVQYPVSIAIAADVAAALQNSQVHTLKSSIIHFCTLFVVYAMVVMLFILVIIHFARAPLPEQQQQQQSSQPPHVTLKPVFEPTQAVKVAPPVKIHVAERKKGHEKTGEKKEPKTKKQKHAEVHVVPSPPPPFVIPYEHINGNGSGISTSAVEPSETSSSHSTPQRKLSSNGERRDSRGAANASPPPPSVTLSGTQSSLVAEPPEVTTADEKNHNEEILQQFCENETQEREDFASELAVWIHELSHVEMSEREVAARQGADAIERRRQEAAERDKNERAEAATIAARILEERKAEMEEKRRLAAEEQEKKERRDREVEEQRRLAEERRKESLEEKRRRDREQRLRVGKTPPLHIPVSSKIELAPSPKISDATPLSSDHTPIAPAAVASDLDETPLSHSVDLTKSIDRVPSEPTLNLAGTTIEPQRIVRRVPPMHALVPPTDVGNEPPAAVDDMLPQPQPQQPSTAPDQTSAYYANLCSAIDRILQGVHSQQPPTAPRPALPLALPSVVSPREGSSALRGESLQFTAEDTFQVQPIGPPQSGFGAIGQRAELDGQNTNASGEMNWSVF